MSKLTETTITVHISSEDFDKLDGNNLDSELFDNAIDVIDKALGIETGDYLQQRVNAALTEAGFKLSSIKVSVE